MKKTVLPLLVLCTVLFIHTEPLRAQSVKNIIKNVAGHLTSLNLEGTWNYEGAAVEFQSDNLLKKAGGKVAASSLESKINNQLGQLGFKPGITQFVFDGDGNFQNITGGKKVSGTYTYDSSSNEITLRYAGHIPVKGKITGSSTQLSLLFEANNFLSLVTFLGSNSGISVIDGISTILKSYDGMMVGMELNKISD